MRKWLILLLVPFLMGADFVVNDVTFRELDDYTDYCADADCVGCWRFNDDYDDLAVDESGNDLHLTRYNSPTSITGKEGDAWDYDSGDSDYFHADVSTITSYPISMCAWFKSNDAANYYAAVSIADSSKTNERFLLFLRGDQEGDYVEAFADGSVSAKSSSGFTANTWHHACAVYVDVDTRHIFLDGGNKGTDDGDADGVTIGNIDAIHIGRDGDTTPTSYLDGLIDEVVIFNRELTAAEVLDIYENGLR